MVLIHKRFTALGIALSIAGAIAGCDRSDLGLGPTVCEYEGLEAACGQLVISTLTRSGDGIPPKALDAVRRAVREQGGEIIDAKQKLGLVVAAFEDDKKLPEIRQALGEAAGVRSVEYNLVSEFE
ncbi:hypothetical protein H0Z60_21080 [Ectothiorhodospiraceae bacterium WFHF3C12]|nr:hypothetical protein [Ectothiorhodospiraceae bacterium WFHF3C12]